MPTPTRPDSLTLKKPATDNRTFTHYAFRPTPCICHHNSVWLCQPCGHALPASDKAYARVLSWRSWYSQDCRVPGMLEGNKGVACGRGERCFASRLVEREEECDASSLAEADGVLAEGRSWAGGGFVAQEMEGIGGTVRMKVRRMVRVGADVDDSDSETSSDEGCSAKAKRYVDTSTRPKVRSWCAWCERVVPGKDEQWEDEWNLGGY